jgi:hypothetical protein
MAERPEELARIQPLSDSAGRRVRGGDLWWTNSRGLKAQPDDPHFALRLRADESVTLPPNGSSAREDAWSSPKQ